MGDLRIPQDGAEDEMLQVVGGLSCRKAVTVSMSNHAVKISKLYRISFVLRQLLASSTMTNHGISYEVTNPRTRSFEYDVCLWASCS
jgi:hypothetical protein